MGLNKKEMASYGIGAVGKDMVYMFCASYILYYYCLLYTSDAADE